MTGSSNSTQLLSDLPPVTSETLSHPKPEDWLIWRRTYDGLGFSPLQGINRTNVANLELAWRTPLEPGEGMPSPLYSPRSDVSAHLP